MGKVNQAKLDFIAQFVTEYHEAHGREACVQAAGALLRLAKRRRALALAECNPPDPWKRYNASMARQMHEDWEESIVRRRERILAKVAATCAPFGLKFESQGDPRGACIKVRFPTAGLVGVPA